MAGGVLAGVMIANNIARLTKGIEAASSRWPELSSRGLTLSTEEVSSTRQASGKTRPVLTGTINGCDVTVHILSDLVHYGTTEIKARCKGTFAAKVGVHPSPGGVLGYLRSILGQDVIVGDEAFDDAFLITSKPDDAAKQLLVPAVRDLISQIERGKLGGVIYEEHTVTVILIGAEGDPTIVGAAIDVATAMASFEI